MKKVIFILFLGVFLAVLQGCGSQNSGRISADKENFLQKEINECPGTIDLAVAFQNDLNNGTHTYFKVYDNLKCQNKTVIDRAVRAAVLDNESTSKQYIDDNLKKAGKAYYSDGSLFDLSQAYPNEYLPVNYINDNLQTYEEAIKDLQEIKKSYPDKTDEEKPKDVKVLLVYNANQDYWDSVFNLMKDNQDDLSWQLMWKAYNYGDDSEVDEQIQEYFKDQGIDNYTKGDIEYTKHIFYNLRVEFYQNSIEFAYNGISDATFGTNLNKIYDKFDKDNAKRQITITNRSAGSEFMNSGIAPNECNTKLHMGFVGDEKFKPSGDDPIPTIFMGIQIDPYYRYVGNVQGNVPSGSEDNPDVDLSDGKGVATFRALYLSNDYQVKINNDLTKYFSKDNQTVVNKYLLPNTNVTTDVLFNDISQVMLSRTEVCLPSMGFYMYLDPSSINPDTPDKNILAFSLDGCFGTPSPTSKFVDKDETLQYLPLDPTTEQVEAFIKNNREYFKSEMKLSNKSTLDNISDKLYDFSEKDLAKYKTTKDQAAMPVYSYKFKQVSSKPGKYIFTRSFLLHNGNQIDKKVLTYTTASKTSDGWLIDNVSNQMDIAGEELPLISVVHQSNFRAKWYGNRITYILPYIGDKKITDNFSLISSYLKGSTDLYYHDENFQYKSSVIKTLTIGKNKYYGFHVIASLLPITEDQRTNPPKALKHFVVVIKETTNDQGEVTRTMFKQMFDISPKDDQRGELNGRLLLDDTFNLFSAEDDSEGE